MSVVRECVSSCLLKRSYNVSRWSYECVEVEAIFSCETNFKMFMCE